MMHKRLRGERTTTASTTTVQGDRSTVLQEVKREMRDFLQALKSSAVVPSTDCGEWTIIYRFKYIVAAKVLQKAKMYQTLLTVGLGGWTVVSFGLNLGPGPWSLFLSTLVSAFTLTMLVVVGHICRRLVGFAYLSKSGDLVKISHLSFYGKRVNTVIPTTEFLPFSMTSKHENYQRLFYNRSGTGNYFYLCPKFAEIPDTALFEKAFGNIESITWTQPETNKKCDKGTTSNQK
jgi:hypothetical protein